MSFTDKKRSPKRMRLGTRSCAECRRRKVRCVFPVGGPACEACILHDTPCHTQQRAELERPSNPTDDSMRLHQRLEELETLVRELRQTGPGSSPIVTRPLAQTSSLSSSESETVSSHEDVELSDGLDHAPLITLIKTALLIENVDAHAEEVEPISKQRNQENIRITRQLLLRKVILHGVLQATDQYWSIWPTYYHGPNVSDQLQSGQVEEAVSCIWHALASSQPPLFAKAILWLALCLQQLSYLRNNSQFQLPADPKSLVESYMLTAKTVLEESSGHEQSLVYVECALFQYKLFINMGKPRKAWLCTRKGLSAALLQGLHRLELHADERRKYVWGQLWHSDLGMSLILGLPWSLSMSQPGLSPKLAPTLPNTEVWYAIGKIAGAIVERDQQSHTLDYATTVRIDQDWEHCLEVVPAEWWNETPSSELSFAGLYYRQVLKLLLFNLRKLIHMPFMLKARVDSKYEHSRVAAMDASREVIRAYCGLRKNKITEDVICELMDFQAFSAGMTIAANLLSKGSTHEISESYSDWNLIESLAATLRHFSTISECTVAAQGAHVLEVIGMARRRDLSAPRRYEATIPYFGKVLLNFSHPTESETASTTSTNHRPNFLDYSDAIDLTVDFFDYSVLSTFDVDSELTMDWTTFFEPTY